jgi:chaperonin GroES
MTQTKHTDGSCHTCTHENPKFQPLGYRVLLKRLKVEETSKKGIILPASSEKKQQEEAKVIAVGTPKTDKNGNFIAIPVAVGDIVLMEKYSGQEVTIDDETFVIVKADDLIAKITR